MAVFVYVLKPLLQNLRIDLSRGNVRVSQHFLYILQLRPVFQQMCGKLMAKRMRRNILFDVSLRGIPLDDFPETLACHTLAV